MLFAWAQDEDEGAMIATADTGKFEISIAEMNVEFAPGIGEMKLKYKLGDSTKVLMERYSDEDFLTKMYVFDKNGRKLYENKQDASAKGEFVWDGYFGDNNKDSLVYENGPFKLSLALTNADSSINNWQDFKDWAYEVFLGDSINTFTTGCDTSFHILNDPIKLDWLANIETYSCHTYLTTPEGYKKFIQDGNTKGVFPSDDFELLEWLNEHEVKTTSVKFLNATVKDVIKEFGMVIYAADSILKADNPALYSSIKSKYSGTHSGLFVRYIGGSSKPSNHSTGAAVDFRVKYNPMYRSSDKAKVGLVKYITGVNLLEEKQSSDALYNASYTFLQKFHGNSTGTSQQVIDKYTLIHAYDAGGVVSFSDLEKIISDTLVVENFNDTVSGVTNKQRLINVLTAHKSSVVFNQNSIDAIDLLVTHINQFDSDTLPQYENNQINNFFTERKAFYAMVTNIGFANLKTFYEFFNKKDERFSNNLILEHGFCDIEVEVYEAFDKAHRMVTKKLLGTEYGVEWGGIYNDRIDAMHFCMPKEVVLELMKQ